MPAARTSRARGVRPLAAALALLLAVVAACTSGGGPSPTPHRADSRPNIVFILTDDLSMNLVPYMPHVQALMQAGTTFRNYFVVDSLCCPSRASIFTGRYPHNTGVFRNTGPDGGYEAYDRFGNQKRSFAVALHAAGYRTALMGKYLNRYTARDPVPPGWDEWDGADAGGYQEYNYALNENGTVHNYGEQPEDYLTGVITAKAKDFITSTVQSGVPFLLEMCTFAPHWPYVPAPQDDGTFATVHAPRGPQWNTRPTDPLPWQARERPLSARAISEIDTAFRRRVESVQSVDRMIGTLEQTLAQHNELDNTYFVFSSDNGYHMGEYRMRPGKQTAFDTDIHVPLVVAGPGVPAGRTVSAMTSSIDLAPTFAQMAGARLATRPDGVSLLGLMHGEPVPAHWQQAVLIEHHGPSSAPGDPDSQPVSAGDPPNYESIRTAAFSYTEYRGGDREYYDLVRDPYELHNVVGTLSEARLQRLHAELWQLARCKGAAQCVRASRLTPSA
jgi:arylsulfatase A-like enzyme